MGRFASRAYGRRFRLTAGIVLPALALAALVPASGAATAAGGLLCDQHTVYGIGTLTTQSGNTATTTKGVVRSIALDTGTTGDVTTLSGVDNALGIADGGGTAYAFSNGGTQLDVYDAVGNTQRSIQNALPANTPIIRGAVNPVTGIYYFATGGSTITVYAYDPSGSGTVIGEVGTISGLPNGNGDFAFSDGGVLFLAAQSQVLRVEQTLPTTAGTTAMTATVVATLPAGTNSPGIAFASDGYLYVAASPNVLKIDPGTGAQVQSFPVGAGNWQLTDLASCTYANTARAVATATERMRAGDQFALTITGGGVSHGNTGTSSGAGDAAAGPVLALAGQTYTVTQSAAGTTASRTDGSGNTVLTEYDTAWTCRRTSEPGSPSLADGTGSTASFTMPAANGSRGTDVACTFTNTPKRASLRLTSALAGPRIDGADQFTVAVQDAAGGLLSAATNDTTTGSGDAVDGGTGTTGATSVVVGRPYTLTQRAADGSTSGYDQYAKTVTCTDATGSSSGLPSGADYDGGLTITPTPDADITCTVSAKAADARITVTTALGEARWNDGDQFTAGIEDPSGSPVGSTAGATSTGTGSTVTTGTGTSVLATAAPGTAYAPVDVPTQDAARYARTVSCVDANHHQATTSGPADGFTVTPVPGADLTCTTTVVLAGSGLTVRTALADPRFRDGDQFTAAVRTGGATGPVRNSTAASTTDGTGQDVTSGTGTTGRVDTDRGVTYTITDAPTADAERYEQSITCTDANGLQSPLPSDAAFTGSFDLAPEPGANLVCTVTAAAKHAVVRIDSALGSARYDDGDQFRAGIQAADGTEAGDPTSETTTGTGSTVEPGTGTTGDVLSRPGTAVTLMASATSDQPRYDRAIACTDANGLQTAGLPSGAFDGSAPMTPEAGADIVCTVTHTMKAAALTATAALSSDRIDDGDQWTVTWTTGAGGAPAARTTTGGSGADIAAGTGTAGPITVADGAIRTLTETVSGHADRYATRLTCRDAAGLQTGLPQDAAFTGSADIVAQAGADLRCTLTTSLAPAALQLHLTGPAASQVGQAAGWVATLDNTGGASALAAVSFALPAGLSYRAVHGAGWSCSARVSTVECAGPQLAGGASGAVTIDLEPAQGAEGRAVLRAAVDPAGANGAVDPAACTGSDLPVAGCDVATTLVGSTPHLRLGLQAPDALTVGVPAVWRGTVADDGTGAAGSATVAVRLPAGLADVRVDGADCTIDGRDALCAVPGPIAVGAVAAFTVTGTPLPAQAGSSAVLVGRLDPQGSATPGDTGACTATDTATGCAVSGAVTVGSGVALAVSISSPAALTEGVPAGYAVTVADRGTGPAPAVIVSVHLPDGLGYRGATGATCSASGQDLACTVPPVPAGGSTAFVVSVQPEPGRAGTVVAPSATVDPAGGTPSPASGCTAAGAGAGCAVADGRRIGTSGLLLSGTVTPVAPAKARLQAGDRVRYGFTVVNRTGAALAHVAVQVPGLGTATCSPAALAVGASAACTLDPVVVTRAQVDAGAVTRDATASGAPVSCASCAPVRSNTVTLAAPVAAVARIAAVQTVLLHDRNGDGVAQLGERVTFMVRVTNIGTVTLHGVRLDDGLVHLTCPRTTLAVGESTVCTGDRVTTAEDVAAGGIRNVATATAVGVARLGTVSSQRTVGTVAADGPASVLAHTGSSLPAGLLGGAALVVAGGVLLLAVRRRRSA